MAFFSISGIRISGIVATVPAHIENNREVTCLDESEREDFINKVGINSRRVAPAGLCASDLGIAAAQTLLSKTGLKGEDIGALVFVTQTPDYLIPGNSMIVQKQLGIPTSALVFDLNQGCAGYVYGLAMLGSIMQTAGIDKGLLLVGDTITRILSPQDRSTVPIFSDAGSATLLERGPADAQIHFNLGADGSGAEAIQMKGGGARHPFTADSLIPEEKAPGVHRAPIHLSMQGLDVLHYSFRKVRPNIQALLAAAHVDLDWPNYFILHQASKILNQGLLKKIGIPAEKAPETLSEYGNTSCATIPLTICSRLSGQLENGSKKLLLAGFGVGFSWGSALVEMGPLACIAVQEIEA